jgi:tripartite-type tricarboxylate transporter receptor subunit TctC
LRRASIAVREVFDFAPVTNVVLGTGYLLMVHPSVRASSLRDLIALAKTGDLSYGSPGVGNTLHLATELFSTRAGIKLLHVPYKGLGPALNAALGGSLLRSFFPFLCGLVRQDHLTGDRA